MATLTPEYRHEPVMLQEVLEALRLSEGSTVCDCTLGGAGHSVKMAAQVGEEGLLIGIDHGARRRPHAPCIRGAGRALEALEGELR